MGGIAERRGAGTGGHLNHRLYRQRKADGKYLLSGTDAPFVPLSKSNYQLRNMWGEKFMIFGGLAWSAITLFFDCLMIVPTVHQALALRFSSTEGTIFTSEVTKHGGRRIKDPTTHGVKVSYSYSVGDQAYTGDRYQYETWSSSDSWASRVVNALPPGTKVRVHYDPANPRNSLLKPGIEGSHLFQLLFLTPFNAVMIGLWLAVGSALRLKWFKPPAGGVKLKPGLRQTRARLTSSSALVTGLATVGLLAFVGTFIVGLGSGGMHPPLRTMVVVWSVILASGGLAAAWHWAIIRSGKYDLILDELNGSLQLPLTQGRQTRQTVMVARVRGVYVSTIEKRSSNGGSSTTTYVPTLRIGGAEVRHEPLIEWLDEDKAQAFVEWLREKLPAKAPTFSRDPSPPDRSEP